jgi:hypothetical protein
VPEDADCSHIMFTSSSSSGNSGEPPWWGLSDGEVEARAREWVADFDARDNELPFTLVFRRENGDLKLASDIIEQFEERLGSPATIVKPK